MPRLPAVPLKGTFDSNTGIYEFGGVAWTPRWYANALKMSIPDCKAIIEAAHLADHVGLPQAVLVVGKSKWEQIEKSYASWVGLTMFHYYAPEMNPGEVPEWLKGIKAHGTKLIHEHKAGVAYLLTYNEPNAMFRYFKRSAPAPTQPLPFPPTGQPVPGQPVPGIPSIINLDGITKIHGIWKGNSFEVNIEREE